MCGAVRRYNFNLSKYLQIVFILLLGAVVLRGVPPSHAQRSLEDTVHDNQVALAVEKGDLGRAHDDIEEIKAKIILTQTQVNANTQSLSNIDAEVRTIGGVLLLVQIGIAMWKKRERPA